MGGQFIAVILALMILLDAGKAHKVKLRNPLNNGLQMLHVYSREHLLSLRQTHTQPPRVFHRYPEIFRSIQHAGRHKSKRKRWGSRGRIQNRLKRRGNRLALPTITLSNVRSLRNKMAELRELVRTDRDFKNVNLICLTENWTMEDMNNINLEGYSLIRYDRDPERAEKRIGGGVCMFINTRWATNFTVRETDCCTH